MRRSRAPRAVAAGHLPKARHPQKKNRWQASPLPAGDVGPRTAGRASAPTNCPGLQRTEPRVHLGMSRTDRAPKTGEGIEGARTYIPTPGCMRERFIMAPTSALFLQPRKKTQATSRGKKKQRHLGLI